MTSKKFYTNKDGSVGYVKKGRKYTLHRPPRLSRDNWYGGSETQNTRWVLELLGHKKNGYFIDIGCNDPVNGNNTYVLERKYSWDGIVVEPNALYFGDIHHMRKCTKILGRPIFEHDEMVDFASVTEDWLQGYSGIEKTLHRASRQKKYSIKKLQAMSPNTLVQECSVPKIFDYLKIDVEGAELNIIKNWPWDKAQPTLVSIESDPETTAKSVIEYMKEIDYKQVKNPYCNLNYEFFFSHSSY